MSKFFKKNTTIKILILILILGTFLRFHQLGTDNLWIDEAITADVTKDLDTTNNWIVNRGAHPPLYLYFMHFWSCLGSSEFMLRLPSAIFSILAIFFIYKIAVLLFNKKVALLSALMVSFSAAHIRMAQELRPYALIILTSAIVVYFLLMALKENKKSLWIAYTISAIISINVDYLNGLLLLTLFLFVLIAYVKQKQIIKPFIISEAIIFLFCTPLIYLFSIQIFHAGKFLFPLNKYWAFLIIPYNFYVFSIGEFAPFMDKFSLVSQYVVPLIIIMFAFLFLFLKGLFFIIKQDKKKAWFLLLILFLPLVVSIIPNLLGFYAKMDPKRYLYISFPYYMILAVGISRLKKKLACLAIIFIIAVSSISIIGYYNSEKPHWQEVASYIENNSKENDVIITGVNWLKIPFKYYYNGNLLVYGLPEDYSYQKKVALIQRHVTNNTNISKIFNERIKTHNRIWYIQSRGNADPNQIVYKYLDRNYDLIEKRYIISNKNLGQSINLSLYKKP